MTGGVWSPERRLLTVALIGLVTAAAFEGMAVPTVMPALVRELGGLDLYGWAFSAFWLTNIIGITLAGSDVDRRGPGRALLIGIVLFSVGLVVSGTAMIMPTVVAGRAIQGFGAGAVGSVVYATIARAYPPTATPRMIALTSSAWVVPGLVGPALAGAIAEVLSWRWIFLGVVPPVLIMAAVLQPQLHRLATPEQQPDAASTQGRRAFDAVLLAVGSTLVLTALGTDLLLVALAVLVVGVVLVVVALRHLLPAGTLRLAPGRPAAAAAVFGIAFAFFGTEAFVPLTVVQVRGGSVTLGGLALSAAAVTWAIGSWLQARAAGAGMRRVVVGVGAAGIGLGIGVTALVLLPGSPVPVAAVGWAIAGLGMGLGYSMLTLIVLETSTPGEEGFSSAALQLMFTLGTAFGAGVGGAIIALADAGTLELPVSVALVDVLMIGVAILTVGVALRVPHSESQVRRGQPLPPALPLEHP